LVEKHREALDAATSALATREYFSRYPESPSPRVYGESASEDGAAAFESARNAPFKALADQPTTGSLVGAEVSPYGPSLGIGYPELDLDAGIDAALAAIPTWRRRGTRPRGAVRRENRPDQPEQPPDVPRGEPHPRP